MPYFKRRLTQAPRDAEFALDYVKANAIHPRGAGRLRRGGALQMDVLWAQLDALHVAYVEPAMIPPGAYRLA